MRTVFNGLIFGGLCALLFSMSSCVTHKEIVLFDAIEGVADSIVANQLKHPTTIRPGDQLEILIAPKYGQDMTLVAPYNINKEGPTPYKVNAKGNITFPSIGEIHLEGMTIEEAREEMALVLSPFLKNPVVIIEMTNFRVTVLGEVDEPGQVSVIGDEMNAIEAIGLAGDFSDFADRKRVMVIRGTGRDQHFGYLNFQSRKIFQEPMFHLQQNDVLYVIPVKQRTIAIPNETQRIIPYLTLGITLLNLTIIIVSL